MNTCVVLVYGLAHSCLGTWLVIGSPVAESFGQQCVSVLGNIPSQGAMRSQDRFRRRLDRTASELGPEVVLGLVRSAGPSGEAWRD